MRALTPRALLALGLLMALAIVPAATLAKTFRVNVVGDPAQMDPITTSELVSGRILRKAFIVAVGIRRGQALEVLPNL